MKPQFKVTINTAFRHSRCSFGQLVLARQFWLNADRKTWKHEIYLVLRVRHLHSSLWKFRHNSYVWSQWYIPCWDKFSFSRLEGSHCSDSPLFRQPNRLVQKKSHFSKNKHPLLRNRSTRLIIMQYSHHLTFLWWRHDLFCLWLASSLRVCWLLGWLGLSTTTETGLGLGKPIRGRVGWVMPSPVSVTPKANNS